MKAVKLDRVTYNGVDKKRRQVLHTTDANKRSRSLFESVYNQLPDMRPYIGQQIEVETNGFLVSKWRLPW